MKEFIGAVLLSYSLGAICGIWAYSSNQKLNSSAYIAQFTECMQTVRDAGEIGYKEIEACDNAAANQAKVKN